MTKATRIINEYHIKEMLLNGNPQFENFYKEELISFCEIAKKIIQKQQKENKKYKEVIAKAINILCEIDSCNMKKQYKEANLLVLKLKYILKEVKIRK